MFLSTETPDGFQFFFFKGRGWFGHIFAASARPWTPTLKSVTSPSSAAAVRGGQYDATYLVCDIRVDAGVGGKISVVQREIQP